MFATLASAGSAAGASSGGLAGILLNFGPLLLVFVAFYFLMIRPQQRRMASLREAVGNVKRNDSVVTAGGILGKVTKVEDQYVEVEIAPNTRVRVVKATLSEVINPNTKPAND